ncbi:WD repeat domain phosphoinositide-interacting protein 3-like protein [Aphelenchoides avenae]|nr:WD repeat domain phosphoinositide-interacting protein 3-like protein [Aphelenchus avenae]
MTVFIESNANAPISSLSFNQDNECFVTGYKDGGFRVFNADPLRQVQAEEHVGGVEFVEILYRSNYAVFVGDGRRKEFPNNKVVVWDCSLRKAIIELLMTENICAVRLTRDRIVVCLTCSIRVYSFIDIPECVACFGTSRNPRGVCALVSTPFGCTLAFPSTAGVGIVEVYDLSQNVFKNLRVKAHAHALSALQYNNSGTLLATASVKGTLIRIFDAMKGVILREFHRGTNSAMISCINFSKDSTYLCVASDRPTVHIYSLSHSSWRSFKYPFMERYLKGNVSFCRLRLTSSEKPGVTCQCAFDSTTNSVVAICTDGSYYKFRFDKNSSNFQLQRYCQLVEIDQ